MLNDINDKEQQGQYVVILAAILVVPCFTLCALLLGFMFFADKRRGDGSG